MIVGNYFPGDSNDKLKWIQHKVYGWALMTLFQCAKRRYWDALRLVGVETELAKRLRHMHSFDHRGLQAAHDQIAAYYRYKHDRCGQMPLFLDDLTYEQHLEIGWRRFFMEEAERLAEIDWIAIPILTAVAYQNTTQGYQAEDELIAMLEEEYGDSMPITKTQ